MFKVKLDSTQRIWVIIIFFSWLSLNSIAEERNEVFKIGGYEVSPGEKKSGFLIVQEKEGLGSTIPITVIHGQRKGRVLALVAGVHGYEYPPILALYRIKESIDPRSISGTLILVQIANLPSFQKRTIYYNPYDWKNLNRVFPGNKEGTISERIAYVITEEIIKRCDYLIDLHCGDGNEALIPYTYWMISGDEKLDEETKSLALAFGIKHIIIDRSRTKELSQSKYLGNTAILLSKPAITTESGYLGNIDEESIQRNIKGILNVMRHLEMIEGKPEYVSPVWIDHYEVVYSDVEGLFFPLTERGYFVTNGEKVGYITDYEGNLIREIRAPFEGIVLYIIYTPPINKGEPILEVGRIKKGKKAEQDSS